MTTNDDTKVSETPTDIKQQTVRKQRLSIRDTCELIQVCYKCNVARISFSDLVIEFAKADQANVTDHSNVPHAETQLTPTVNQDQIEEDSSDQKITEEDLDLLTVEDPVAAEKVATSENPISELRDLMHEPRRTK